MLTYRWRLMLPPLRGDVQMAADNARNDLSMNDLIVVDKIAQWQR
jgi:hypothetical protein